MRRIKPKVLIIKIGAIGDLVRSLSMLNYLENSEITWVAGKNLSSLIKASDYRINLLTVDENKLFHGKIIERLLEVFKIWKKIGFRFFNQIIVAHSDWRFRIFSLFSWANQIRFFPKIRNLKKDPLMRRIKNLSLEKVYISLAFFPFPKKASFLPFDYPDIKRDLAENLIETEKPLVAIVPGGAKNFLADDDLRRWPIEYYQELSSKLTLSGFQVLLIGSQTDMWVLPYFKDIAVKNLISKTALLDLVAIFRKCALVITHDTGALHLAALAKAKTLGLFGPTDPNVVIDKQLHPNVQVLTAEKKLDCLPCGNGRKFASCKTKKCLYNLTPEKVFKIGLASLKIPEKEKFYENSACT